MALGLGAGAWRWMGIALLVARTMALSSAADYFVKSLPGQPKDQDLLRMHAGHIEVNAEHHGNMFFWHFENKHLANRHRTVIWLNGGPGCSSLDGALMEIGPYKLKDSENLVYQPDSWNEFANLLFVDNPVGTGFSYVDSDSFLHELPEMAAHFVIFLERYFALFPEQEGNDFYLAGESYAGQHIPYVAKAILEHNAKTQGKKWNLQGLLIGNGWISPPEQSLSYLEHVYKAGIITKDSDIARQLEAQQNICKNDLEASKDHMNVNYPQCEKILRDILKLTLKNDRCLNMYDLKKDDTYPACGMNWPPDLEFIKPWLRRRDVVEALHVNPDKKAGWVECSAAVGSAFRAQNSEPAVKLMPDLLKQLPILLFSGADDLICSHIGTENFIHNMEWNGGKGFETSPGIWAPRQDWTYDGEAAGYYQQARNLTYVLFYNASHMVPWDYPRRTRDMLDRFMGVDIASIGGKPGDSRINGEKSSQTSVGGHPNSTVAEQQVEQKIDQERWAAYYRSGSFALVVVAILAVFFGWYVWQDRRRRAGYRGVAAAEPSRGAAMSHNPSRRDVEAAGAFDVDDNELDTLQHDGRGVAARYSLGGLSEEDEEEAGHHEKQTQGRTGVR